MPGKGETENCCSSVCAKPRGKVGVVDTGSKGTDYDEIKERTPQ